MTDVHPLAEEIRGVVLAREPELIDLLELYLGEADFGRVLIDPDLRSLAEGARILEIGAGALILAARLAHEGYRVIAVEPGGDGFGHLGRLGRCVGEVAAAAGLDLQVVDVTGEEYVHDGNPVDLAFSINVLEHVSDPARVVECAVAALAPGACFHAVCPNYAIPYEPHFNAVTLGSRRWTERFLARRWIERATFPDPQGTWDSLNWITPRNIRRMLRSSPSVEHEFSGDAFRSYVERLSDGSFLERKGPAFGALASVARRLARWADALPATLIPVIDVRFRRLPGDATGQPESVGSASIGAQSVTRGSKG